jgi:hypothetical protein
MKIMSLIRNAIFGAPPEPPVLTVVDHAYQQAMAASDDLIAKMRERSASPDPMRSIMADIWSQNHNVPYMTTIYESVQEMNVVKKGAGNDGRD